MFPCKDGVDPSQGWVLSRPLVSGESEAVFVFGEEAVAVQLEETLNDENTNCLCKDNIGTESILH